MTSIAAEMASAMRSHEEIFRYWKGLKKRGRLPSRADIDPVGFRKLLPTISLIDVLEPEPQNNPEHFRQRLAGTELFSAYGKEITGKSFSQIYEAAQAKTWAMDLSEIARTKKPNVGLFSMEWCGAKGLYLFWLRMPLASDGVHVDMILGHDVMLGRPDIIQNSGIRAA